MKLFRWLLILVFGFFLTRTIDLLILRGSYFRRLAEENRIRRIRLFAARGRILTVDGQALAQNNIEYFLDGQKLSRIEALKEESRGRELEKVWVREYPLKEAAAHLTGYLGEATEKEIDYSQIVLTSLVGRGGLEQVYDSKLRGTDGEKLFEVNALGEIVRQLGRKLPQPGEDLNLTIDSRWQRAIWEALKGRKGAIVVSDPRTGAILGLISNPSFDPNAFVGQDRQSEISNYLSSSELPMLNRAIGGAYHPGSVFKIVPAIAGLEEGKIDGEKEVEDVGVIKIGQWEFGNWYWLENGRTEGMVNLTKAIKRSNDIYFYKLGEWLGVEELLVWAEKFGLGQKTSVDLPAEVSGFLPDPEWKEKATDERWFLGNTYHLSIGQGDLTMSPLQVNREVGVIANGGYLCQPYLNRDKDSNCLELQIKKDHLELVKEGMREACSAGGTGFPFFGFQPQVACKTGTAEISAASEETHAWFTLFYPVEKPEIVMTVLLERGGSGAYDAAPVAKEAIERYRGDYKLPKQD